MEIVVLPLEKSAALMRFRILFYILIITYVYLHLIIVS